MTITSQWLFSSGEKGLATSNFSTGSKCESSMWEQHVPWKSTWCSDGGAFDRETEMKSGTFNDEIMASSHGTCKSNCVQSSFTIRKPLKKITTISVPLPSGFCKKLLLNLLKYHPVSTDIKLTNYDERSTWKIEYNFPEFMYYRYEY